MRKRTVGIYPTLFIRVSPSVHADLVVLARRRKITVQTLMRRMVMRLSQSVRKDKTRDCPCAWIPVRN